MVDKLVLKNRLREISKDSRLCQKDLAYMVGVSCKVISSINRLKFVPSAKLPLILAIVLDLGIFYF